MSTKKEIQKKSAAFQFLIATPSFNQAQFIEETLQSVMNQDQKLDYWVIDGASKDKTKKILKKFDKQLHWVSEKDNGQADAINKAVKKFKLKVTKENTIFAYINSDDYYLPGAFKKVSAAFQANPEAQWLVGDCQIVNVKGKKIQQFIGWYKWLVRKFYFPQLVFILNHFPHPAVFIRGTAVRKVGKFNDQLHYVMDYEYWLRFQRRFGSPLFLDQELAAFRIHNNSKGGTQFVRHFAEQYQVVCRFTRKSILLFAHKLHNVVTSTIYQIIK